MVVETLLGNVNDVEFKGLELRHVSFDWFECAKRLHRKAASDGTDIIIRLDHHAAHRGLYQGDVLAREGNVVYAVDILPCECIAVTVHDSKRLAKLCYEIGNRHAPLFYGDSDNAFVTPFDKPMADMIERLGYKYEVKQVKLSGSDAISASMSSYSHSHSHTREG
jgi:urease accessory protein